ncbi:hypothetical protein BDN70DRAFT_990563 [Pholiota conissans]|uniref:DUF6534 domain-containing protein n=1 Tax=Pholiota conissans TaxID=109636 RepID=A0A9P5ZC55_9AGAR|nr:hypothetical protein BDN70DRAFT_990563 [Pholiota conissans]
MSLDPSMINLTAITAPPFIGIILNWGLFGILSLQVYFYFQAFLNDRKPLKFVVGGVYIFEVVQTALMTQTAWNQSVSGFGNLAVYDEIGTAWLSVGCIGGLVGLLVQTFYAYRISVFSKNRIIPGLVVLMALTSFAGALSVAVNTKREGKFSILLAEPNESFTFTTIGLWIGTRSACDLVITACMCYYLHAFKKYGSFSKTQDLLSKLVRMTIETGMLTASISILTLALYYAPRFKNLSYFQITLSAEAKLYSTTMLAVLNSRMKVGVASESTTWLDNELVFTLPRSTQDTRGIKVDLSSSAGSVHHVNIPVRKDEEHGE